MDAYYIKKLQNRAINKAINGLVLARRRDGMIQKNSYSSILDALHKIRVNITRDALYKCIDQGIKNQTPVEVLDYKTITHFSSITNKDYNDVNHFSKKSTTMTSCNSLPSTMFTLESKAASTLKGRPKGSTNEKKQKDKMSYDACLESICNDYVSEMENNKAFKRCCPRNFLDRLIKEKKEEYNVSNNISLGTICSQVWCSNHNAKHHGTKSPLDQAEDKMVTVCIQIGKIQQPLSVKEGIALMNSFISGTHLEKVVVSN